MGKGDDALIRKRSRARRKKMRGEQSVSARVAAIIASKRRRKSGKRRRCEGMCFTLPTPEDPFNDRNDPKAKKEMAFDKCRGGKTTLSKLENGKNGEANSKLISKSVHIESQQHRKQVSPGEGGSEDCPSKFLILCLNAIQNAWIYDPSSNDCTAKALLVSRWGIDFWRHCSCGLDILDISGACAVAEQIAWLISTMSDTIARKEKGGVFIQSPFLLYIVPSQERAAKVRAICKPLKDLGVHTVSLHPGSTIGHQVRGLKNCEPEFVISTPERLLDLVSLGAIDISEASVLVVDGLRALFALDSMVSVRKIRSLIVKAPQTIVFGESMDESTGILTTLTTPPVCKLSLNDFA